jgi:type I restriction enzyme, S subunit
VSELPKGWADSNVKQVCELRNGRAYAQDELLVSGKYPVLRVGNFFSNRGWYYSDLELEAAKYCGSGDLLYAWSASFGPKIWDGGTVIYHYHIWRVDIEPMLIEKRFLFHWFEWDKENIKADLGTGSTMMHVTKGGMEARRLSLPPLDEQRRIVAKVDGLTARTARARKELHRIPTLIACYKQRLLALAFSGELTAGWRKERNLPDAKEVGLVEVAKGFSYGSSAKSAPTGDVPVLRMGNIQNGKLDWKNLVFTSDKAEIKKYTLIPGDVLFNRTNSPELVGKTALYKGEREAVYAGYLIRIQCTEKLMPEFLTYCLNGPAGREYCWDVKTDGVSQSNINAKKIAAFRFLLPRVEEQAEIVRRIESAFGWLDRMAADHAAAARLLPKLDAAILSKAFRGELVPQDPNDEPASVLLERIKAEREASPRKTRGRGAPRFTIDEDTLQKLDELKEATGPTQTDQIRAVIRKGTTMPKSRQDDDVKDKPYLAGLLKSVSRRDVESLFRAADLPVADFYKQLAWEIDKGHIIDHPETLKAA